MGLRIAIDASRVTSARITGTERYALDLLRALLKQPTTHSFALYFRQAPPPPLLPSGPHVTQHVIPFPRLWTHLRFAAALWQHQPDVTFVPAHTLPLLFPGSGMVTVHDLGYRYFPQAHPARQRLYLDWTTRFSADRAAVVLADSAATARDLTRFYGTPAQKIHVLYPGVTPPTINNAADVRAKYRLPDRYWLFVGTLQPRKNIETLVKAYRLWRERHPQDHTGLVLAGGRGWLYDPSWIAGVEGIQALGYIDEQDKGALYQGARALLMPSLYEGFGFPVVEALHCGTAVIASDSSSLPEVGGTAADYVHLPDILLQASVSAEERQRALQTMAEALADAMAAVPQEPPNADIIAARKAQAARFSWSAAAQQLLGIFDSLEKSGS